MLNSCNKATKNILSMMNFFFFFGKEIVNSVFSHVKQNKKNDEKIYTLIIAERFNAKCT